jgi:hypothetical protein
MSAFLASSPPKYADAAVVPNPAGKRIATVAFPRRTAFRAPAAEAAFTSSAASAVRSDARLVEIALLSSSARSTWTRLASCWLPVSSKMNPKNDAMAMGASTDISTARRSAR